jgi:ATP-dependent protease ClpP protease subunit
MPAIDLAGLETLRAERGKGPKARSCRLALSADVARLDLMGDIDPFWGISAASVLTQLDQITAPEIRIRLSSYGGDVLEGVAIHNALAAHPARKVMEIIGCAASAASWIAMVADEILIWDSAFMMIHQSWQFAGGNADVLEEVIGTLRKIDDAMAAAYVRRTGLPDAEIRAMMAAETWMTADEAVAKKFADRVLRMGDIPTTAAAEPAKRAGRTISPDILAGLQGLADAMAPKGG